MRYTCASLVFSLAFCLCCDMKKTTRTTQNDTKRHERHKTKWHETNPSVSHKPPPTAHHLPKNCSSITHPPSIRHPSAIHQPPTHSPHTPHPPPLAKKSTSQKSPLLFIASLVKVYFEVTPKLLQKLKDRRNRGGFLGKKEETLQKIFWSLPVCLRGRRVSHE